MVNCKHKGSRGEREVRDLFRDAGFQARRGQQFSGSPDSPDVITDVPWIHVESKFCHSGAFYEFLSQAEADAGLEQIPTVFWRRNGRKWLLVMDAKMFLTLIKKMVEKGVFP
jgi:Holliday junction resolvase